MAKKKAPAFFVMAKPAKTRKKLPLYAAPNWSVIHVEVYGKNDYEVVGMSAWDGFRPTEQYAFVIANEPRFHETIDFVVRAWEQHYPDLDWDFQILWSDATGKIRLMPFTEYSITASTKKR